MSSFGFDANDFPSGIKTMETYWNPQEYGQEMSRTCRHWLLLNVNYGFPILSVDIHNILRCWVTHHIPYMVVTQISTWFLVYTSMPFRREKTTCWTEILPLWSIKTELNCDCTDCKKKEALSISMCLKLMAPRFHAEKTIEPWNSYLPLMIQRCSTARFFFRQLSSREKEVEVKLLSWCIEVWQSVVFVELHLRSMRLEFLELCHLLLWMSQILG